MIKDIKQNKIHYSVLAIGSGIFLILFLANQTNTTYMFRSSIAFAIFYVFWGFFHHYEAKSLTGKVMLEYILVAVLALVVASSLLI